MQGRSWRKKALRAPGGSETVRGKDVSLPTELVWRIGTYPSESSDTSARGWTSVTASGKVARSTVVIH